MNNISAVAQTGTAALSTVVLANTLQWLFSCITAHGYLPPTNDLIYQWAGLLAPLAHAFYLKFMKRAGVDVTPPQTTQGA